MHFHIRFKRREHYNFWFQHSNVFGYTFPMRQPNALFESFSFVWPFERQWIIAEKRNAKCQWPYGHGAIENVPNAFVFACIGWARNLRNCESSVFIESMYLVQLTLRIRYWCLWWRHSMSVNSPQCAVALVNWVENKPFESMVLFCFLLFSIH